MPRFKPKRPPYKPKPHYCDECDEIAMYVDLFGTNACCSNCGCIVVLEGDAGIPAWPETMWSFEC